MSNASPAARASTANYSIDPDRLLSLGSELGQQYRTAKPYPHIVLDDFFPAGIVDAALAEFPSPGDIDWQSFENRNEKKLACNNERSLGPVARSLIWEMNSQVFLQFLERLTGIENLIADPQLAGGGMHQIPRGGKLGVHVDFNRHRAYGLDRRLNLLLYLNKDWDESYGGHLELWGHDKQQCERRILPVFNRVVIFSTTESSWHGHPTPLTCPEGRTRKSLALYYYTNSRPAEGTVLVHSTIFQGDTAGGARAASHSAVRMRDFVPPILVRAWKRLRRSRTPR